MVIIIGTTSCNNKGQYSIVSDSNNGCTILNTSTGEVTLMVSDQVLWKIDIHTGKKTEIKIQP